AARAGPAGAAAAGQARARPPGPTAPGMGYPRLAVDVGIYIADARGYLQQEGIDLELIYFANGSEMIPALATGQLEIGGGAANPATLNAIARGIPLKAVLDRGSFRPGVVGDQSVVIRKEVYDRGR